MTIAKRIFIETCIVRKESFIKTCPNQAMCKIKKFDYCYVATNPMNLKGIIIEYLAKRSVQISLYFCLGELFQPENFLSKIKPYH